MITDFIFALLATAGCCLIFHVPARCIAPAAAIGGIGWITYRLMLSTEASYVLAVFIAALAVALLADICSRLLRDAATIFVIPGIIPLVPGAGMYYTMFYFIQGDMSLAQEWAIRTVMIAGAIAVGLLVMASVIKTVIHIKRRIRN